VVLLLVEATDDPGLIQRSIEAIRQQIAGNGKHLVVVLNKSDQVKADQLRKLEQGIALQQQETLVSIAAEKGEHIDRLTRILLDIVSIGSLKHQDVVISNVRHYNALRSASEGLARVSEGITSALPSDLLAQDIREALHYLGEITGEVTTDEILGNIFRNFCIGK
jgi:tRNA modification GTPase